MPEVILKSLLIMKIVTPNDNMNAFAQAIIKMTESSEQTQRFATFSKKRFNHYFSAASMNTQYEKLFTEYDRGSNRDI